MLLGQTLKVTVLLAEIKRHTPKLQSLQTPGSSFMPFPRVTEGNLDNRNRFTLIDPSTISPARIYNNVVDPAKRRPVKSYCFEFYGREAFSDLYEKAVRIGEIDFNQLHLCGALGYGKSYMLAALACRLMAEKRYVIYIQNCKSLLGKDSLVSALKEAILLPFCNTDGGNYVNRIWGLKSVPEIIDFLQRFVDNSGSSRPLYIMADHFNLLDELEGDSTFVRYTKGKAKSALAQIASLRNIYAIFGASGTCEAFSSTLGKQSSIESIYLAGGFSKASPMLRFIYNERLMMGRMSCRIGGIPTMINFHCPLKISARAGSNI